MSSVEETEAAVAGARTAGLPVVATLSFDTNGRTMMGITPSELAGLHRKHHLAACGSNCGVSPSELVASIVNLAAASESARGAGGEGQLRHSAIRRRRHPLRRHARVDGHLRRSCARCRRAHHRRLLRHDAGALAPHARARSNRMCRARSPTSPPSKRSSARSPPARRRSCAANSIASRARRPAPPAGARGRRGSRAVANT